MESAGRLHHPEPQCLQPSHPHCGKQRGWSPRSVVFWDAKATVSRERKACGSVCSTSTLRPSCGNYLIIQLTRPLCAAEDMGKDRPFREGRMSIYPGRQRAEKRYTVRE